MIQREKIDVKKRNFLKWLFFAVGAAVTFLLGKTLGPSIGLFSHSRPFQEGEFKNFRFTEDSRELKLYDRLGNEIFIIEKDSTQ